MEVLSLDQQKKAILYAPKDLLWKILDAEDGSWLKILSLLPEEYYAQFLNKLRLLGVEENQQVKNMAKIYVQNKVRMDHLQEAIVQAWNPSDMEDATSFLKANGFLRRPLLPLNLQAETSDDAIIAEALSVPRATRERLARRAKGVSPKVGNPPDGANEESITCWNTVMRDPKRRKTILAPSSVADQWALAQKFWLKECRDNDIPAFKSQSSSTALPAHTTLKRSVSELHTGLCSSNYTMSRPAARLFKQLFDQLAADGHDLGEWSPIKAKGPRGF